MKPIYFSSVLLWQKELAPIFALAKQYHVGGIEFWACQARYFHYDETRIRHFLSDTGIHAVVHSKSWDLNFASLEPAIRAASLSAIKDSMDFAASIGAEEITVHPPHHTFLLEKDASPAFLRQSLQELRSYANAHGIRLSLEIMEKLPREMITGLRTAQEALGAFYTSSLYTVDTAHCSSIREIHSLMQALPKVSKIHISNRRGAKLHTPLESGDYDFSALLPDLLNYGCPLVLEGAGFTDDTMLACELQFIENILQGSSAAKYRRKIS